MTKRNLSTDHSLFQMSCFMIKPWQAPLNKAPSKGGKEEQRESTQLWVRRAKPKVAHKGAKEQKP